MSTSRVTASPSAFGAQIGGALPGVGRSLEGVGAERIRREEQRQAEEERRQRKSEDAQRKLEGVQRKLENAQRIQQERDEKTATLPAQSNIVAQAIEAYDETIAGIKPGESVGALVEQYNVRYEKIIAENTKDLNEFQQDHVRSSLGSFQKSLALKAPKDIVSQKNAITIKAINDDINAKLEWAGGDPIEFQNMALFLQEDVAVNAEQQGINPDMAVASLQKKLEARAETFFFSILNRPNSDGPFILVNLLRDGWLEGVVSEKTRRGFIDKAEQEAEDYEDTLQVVEESRVLSKVGPEISKAVVNGQVPFPVIDELYPGDENADLRAGLKKIAREQYEVTEIENLQVRSSIDSRIVALQGAFPAFEGTVSKRKRSALPEFLNELSGIEDSIWSAVGGERLRADTANGLLNKLLAYENKIINSTYPNGRFRNRAERKLTEEGFISRFINDPVTADWYIHASRVAVQLSENNPAMTRFEEMEFIRNIDQDLSEFIVKNNVDTESFSDPEMRKNIDKIVALNWNRLIEGKYPLLKGRAGDVSAVYNNLTGEVMREPNTGTVRFSQ